MHTISNEYLVASVPIATDGSFFFSTELLPDDEQLYRIHFIKQGDPATSLIIGGKDHNHTFLFAAKDDEFNIEIQSGDRLIGGVKFTASQTNTALVELNKLSSQLDSIDYMGSNMNREFLRKAAYDRLRSFADTCSCPLVSLYAIYKCNFKSDYKTNTAFYKKYLKRWRSEDSRYFEVFRDEYRDETYSRWINFIFGSIGLALLVLLVVQRLRKSKNKSPLAELTIQERKIFNSIREGKSNTEIADEFSVSLSTIKSHINSIYAKLGIKTRKEIMNV